MTAPLNQRKDDGSVNRLELWKVPASELNDIELEQQYQYAADRFDNQGEHGGSPGEYWAERLDEIEAEQKRRVPPRVSP